MDRWALATFLLLLGTALYLLFRTVFPFFEPVLLAAIFVVFTWPMQQWLARKFGGRRKLAGLVSSAVLVLGIILPSAGLVTLVLKEAVEALPQVRDFLVGLEANDLMGPNSWLGRLLPQRVAELLPSATELLGQVGGSLGALARGLLTGLAQTTFSLTLNGFILLVSAYYFYVDGENFLRLLMRIVPLSEDYKQQLFHEFRATIIAVFFGTAVVAFIQGALTWLVFVVVGIPSALLWGAIAVFVSLIPVLGPVVVWLPAGVTLLVLGDIWQGVVVVLWGSLLVSTIDNVLRPLLVKGRLHLHPLMVFLTLFGGLAAFGVIGFLLGPIIASLCMVLLRIWRRDVIPEEL